MPVAGGPPVTEDTATADDGNDAKTGVFMAAFHQQGSLGLACFDSSTAKVAFLEPFVHRAAATP